MKQLIRYLIWFLLLFAAYNSQAQNNTVYGAGISYTNGAPTWTPNPRTSRAAVDTVTGRWYHFNTPGGWQWIGNTVEEISGCAAPAYTPNKGDSRLVVNNCVKPQLYWYDGAVWKWINQGEVYTAGQGIRIESNTIILDSLYVLRFRTGSNTDGAAGTMSWNATEETLDLVTDQGAVTGHLMESAYYNTRNTTGTPITIGTVVMANGTTGNTGRILIAPAIADGSVNSEYILGLTAQAIGNNSNGKVQHFGKIRGIQTNGANYGETWVDGDVLYCSAAAPGYLTKVLPTAPNLKVPIAIVIHAHPSNGTLFVRPSHFPDLAQINDVQLSSPTNGQVLTWNSTNARWEAITPANQLQTLSTDGSAGNISISSGNTITLNVNDADASTTNELQTLSVAANTATLSNSGGSVTIAGAGINTVGTAGTTITVTGTEVDGSTTNELQTLSTGTNTLTLSNGGGTVTVDTDPSTDVTGSGVINSIPKFTAAQTLANSTIRDSAGFVAINTFPFVGGGLPVTFAVRGTGTTSSTRSFAAFRSNGTNYFSLGNDGRFTIGDYGSPSSTNLIQSSTNLIIESSSANGSVYLQTSLSRVFRTDQLFNNSAGLAIGKTSAAAGRLEVVGSGTSSSTWTAQFHNSAGNNNALMIRDDGNIGIGTNSPTVKLQINGTSGDNFRVTNGVRNAYIQTTNNTVSFTTGTNGSGAGFSMAGDGSSVQFQASGQQKMLVVGSTGNVIIQDGGTFTDDGINRLQVIGSGKFTGKVEIGTTTSNASAVLEVESTTQGILFPRMTTAQRDLIATPADGLVIYNTTDNKLQVRAGGAWVDLH